jgi:hypothetical protein
MACHTSSQNGPTRWQLLLQAVRWYAPRATPGVQPPGPSLHVGHASTSSPAAFRQCNIHGWTNDAIAQPQHHVRSVNRRNRRDFHALFRRDRMCGIWIGRASGRQCGGTQMRVRLFPVLTLAIAASFLASDVTACGSCNRRYPAYGYVAPPAYAFSPGLPTATTVGRILRNYCSGRNSPICTGRLPEAYGYVYQPLYYGYRPRAWGWRGGGYRGWRR